MPKTRQQRRAHRRRPVSRRKTSGRVFAASMIVLIIGGVALAYVFKNNPPPLTRGAIVGEHWHASYKIFVCGRRMTNFPTVEGEIHSHGDGFLHIHPATAAYAADNANLGTFLALYETQIGLTSDGKRFMAFPGGLRFQDGQKCPDGKKYTLELLNKGKKVGGDPSAFHPHDGDQLVIRFGPEGTKLIANPYSATKGIPDAGISGGAGPQGDTGATQPIAPPQAPPSGPSTSGPAASP